MTRPSGAATGWCAAVLDLDVAAAAALAREVDAFTCRLPPQARAAIRTGFAAVDALAVARTGRRLAALDRAARARFVERLPVDLAEVLKVPVLLVHGARQATPELLARAAASPPARPDAVLHVTPATEWPSRSVAGAVVIGSGAGGAMAARTLARAGLDVVVLEEGERHGVESFRTRPALDRFASLYRDAGATVMLGTPPVYLPVGRGVGGTTLVNSGTCYRTPPAVLARWRAESGVDLDEAWLDEVWRTLQVAPVPPAVMGRNGALALAGAAALGWSSHPLSRNAPGCGGCCQCAIGCPRNAKFGVHLNALPEACAAGARIVSGARVERVLHARGRATGVRVRRRDGTALEVLAPLVVVAAGATETPPLLRRSGLGRHPHLGRNLAVHPAVSAAGRFDEPVDATRGVLQSAAIDEFHASDGILVEATSTPPGMGSMVLPGAGAPLVRELAASRHLAQLGAMVADLPSGRVLGARRPTLVYRLARRDAARLVRSIEVMGEALFAAGATEVLTGIAGHERVRSVTQLRAAAGAADPRRLHVAAFHPTGSARMGADPQAAPVDVAGRLRGLHGVWVADGSVLPSCPEVNPQVTIMALALQVASAMIDGA